MLYIILFTAVGRCLQDMAHRPVALGGDGLRIVEGSCECNEQGGRDFRQGVVLQLGGLGQWLTVVNVWKYIAKNLTLSYLEILK